MPNPFADHPCKRRLDLHLAQALPRQAQLRIGSLQTSAPFIAHRHHFLQAIARRVVAFRQLLQALRLRSVKGQSRFDLPHLRTRHLDLQPEVTGVEAGDHLPCRKALTDLRHPREPPFPFRGQQNAVATDHGTRHPRDRLHAPGLHRRHVHACMLGLCRLSRGQEYPTAQQP